VPFAYYQRLNREDRALYRKSDARTELSLPDAAALKPLLEPLRVALEADQVRAVQKTSTLFVRALAEQLESPPVSIRVLSVRPSDAESELHGFYELDETEDGKPDRALIRVWMRTAAKKQPVAFKSFVRTILHEVCHHVDFTRFELAQSFHTEGFFSRESHLARQLLDVKRAPAAREEVEAPQLAFAFAAKPS
jgi:hypothetical protein